MKTIVATDITLKQKLPIQTIMSFYKEIKSWGGEVFLIQNRKMVDSTKLSKLIAFMLTINEDSPIKMIVEGPQSDQMRQKLLEKLHNKRDTRKGLELEII